MRVTAWQEGSCGVRYIWKAGKGGCAMLKYIKERMNDYNA